MMALAIRIERGKQSLDGRRGAGGTIRVQHENGHENMKLPP